MSKFDDLPPDMRPGAVQLHILDPMVSEKETAEAIHRDVESKLSELCDIIAAARRQHGLIVNFQIGGVDAFGRRPITMLEITKKLA